MIGYISCYAITSYLGIFDLNKELVHFIEIRMESSKNSCNVIVTI